MDSRSQHRSAQAGSKGIQDRPYQHDKPQAREKLRERIAEETGITADSRVTVGWFIEQSWKPLHEGGWRESTKKTNEELLKVLTDHFRQYANRGC